MAMPFLETSAEYSIRGTHEGVAKGARYLPGTAAATATAA
jgi:hypothetical protein